jgi:uncharacterized membrane protein YtjA (UPF0391 family)
MLSWSAYFLIIAFMAAQLDLFSIASVATEIARLFAGVFLVLFVLSLFLGRRVV